MSDRAPPPSSLGALVTMWREQVRVLRNYGAGEQASAIERCIEDSVAALRQAATETLSPAEAAAESGLTADSITRLMRKGKIPNLGTRRRPRARRCDLPRKAKPAITEIALLPDSENSGTVAPDLLRAVVGAKLTGGRRA